MTNEDKKFIENFKDADEETIRMLVEIGINLADGYNGFPKNPELAKKFFMVGEAHLDQEATVCLSDIQTNPLIKDAMWLRAAAIDANCPMDNLHEDYKEQAAYWRKKIAEAEGKPFVGDAPTDDEIFKSARMTFFNMYKRAFEGDLNAMKDCLEFCEEETDYWAQRCGYDD